MDATLAYLFSSSPGNIGEDWKFYTVLGLGIILIFLAVFSPTIKRKTTCKPFKKILAKSRLGITSFGIGFLFFAWMRLEQVPFLSMRFWVILTLFSFIAWLGWKVAGFIKIKKRIEKAEKRRKK